LGKNNLLVQFFDVHFSNELSQLIMQDTLLLKSSKKKMSC